MCHQCGDAREANRTSRIDAHFSVVPPVRLLVISLLPSFDLSVRSL